MDDEGLAHLLRRVQDGVVARRQVRALGGTDADIARMLRRRELRTVHPGVYVDHTGPLTVDQRRWAAVLVHWPAALTLWSALPSPPASGPVHVAVDVRRTVRPVPGVRAHRSAGFDHRVRWNSSPPRVALDHAVLDVAARTADPHSCFRLVAEVCHSRQTTPRRLLDTLAGHSRVRGRAFLTAVLEDLDSGACSVLERAYLDLERRHGLPVVGRRQTRVVTGRRVTYRDVDHRDFGVVVELDGRAFHDSPTARDRDLERDLDTAVTSGLVTVRLGYGQVLGRGCATMTKVAALLAQGGWPGPFSPCPQCPPSPRS